MIYIERIQGKNKGQRSCIAKKKTEKIQEKVGISFQSTRSFKAFQEHQSFPRHPRKRFQSIPGLETPRIVLYASHSFPKKLDSDFTNSCTFSTFDCYTHVYHCVCKLIIPFNCIFMPVHDISIVRVLCSYLGVFNAGKIGR